MKACQSGGLFATETSAYMCIDEEFKRAEKEDRIVERALGEVFNRPPRPMSTPESIAAGHAAMAEGRERAAEALARRIESKELLSAAELRSALGIPQAEIDDAVVSNRLFSFEAPGGEHYYPAFFAAADMERPSLELVAQKLGGLPAASKYHFFLSKWTNLGETPLDALKRGRVDEVLQAAAGFVDT